MKAARLRAWGTRVEVTELPAPEPREGEVVVRLAAAAVTHLDLTVMSGEFAHRPELPCTPGTSGVGTVIAEHPGSDAGERGSWLGRRVLVRGGGIGLERDGTWAEQVAVPVSALRAIPDSVAAPLAATCYSPLTTAWAAVEAVGRVRPGERVVVTGASGGVGSLCVQLARRAGASVTAMVSREERIRDVPADAAESVLAGWTRRTADRIAADGGADVLIDPVGGDTLELLLPTLNPGARAVLVGYVRGTGLTLDLPNLLAADVSLLPVNMIRRQVPDEVFGGLLGDLDAGRLDLAATVHPFPDLAAAITARRTPGNAGTVALSFRG